ncbi:phospholipase D-like domain-containing protein [Spirillospora sp. CA-128828]|uniref:phospholipase D-like domain-containing protein n=1 Tax=Spirillospora sp. CA-128828 TaxID=3240033 RepID=UPI003D8ADE4D
MSQARHYIYIEDQYLVSRRLKALLVDRLRDPQFKFLLILMENSRSFEHDKELITPAGKFPNEFPYLIGARNEMRADFAKADPGGRKWRMFSLTRSPDDERRKWCGPYVHAKTCLIDDEFAVIGTVNVDDRGYTFDSEIVAGITDDMIGRMSGRRFARDLRVNLWHKHLAVPHTRLATWESGLKIWQKPPPEAMVVDNTALEYSPLLGAKGLVRDDPVADGMWGESIDPDADRLP